MIAIPLSAPEGAVAYLRDSDVVVSIVPEERCTLICVIEGIELRTPLSANDVRVLLAAAQDDSGWLD